MFAHTDTIIQSIQTPLINLYRVVAAIVDSQPAISPLHGENDSSPTNVCQSEYGNLNRVRQAPVGCGSGPHPGGNCGPVCHMGRISRSCPARSRLRRSGVSGDRLDRPGPCRPALRSEADADRRRAEDGAPDRLHAAACGRDRRNAAGAGPDRAEAAVASDPVLPEAFRPQIAGAAEADDRPVRRSAAEAEACARVAAEACDPEAADGAQAEAEDSACSNRRSRSGGRWRACSGCLCTTSTGRPSGRTRNCGRCSRGSARRRRRRECRRGADPARQEPAQQARGPQARRPAQAFFLSAWCFPHEDGIIFGT